MLPVGGAACRACLSALVIQSLWIMHERTWTAPVQKLRRNCLLFFCHTAVTRLAMAPTLNFDSWPCAT